MAFAYGSVSYSFSYVYIDTSNLQNLLIFFLIFLFFINFKESESIEILLCIIGRELWEHFSCSCSHTEYKLGILFAAPWPDFYKSGVHAMQICFESWQGSIPNHLGAESICILWSKSILYSLKQKHTVMNIRLPNIRFHIFSLHSKWYLWVLFSNF